MDSGWLVYILLLGDGAYYTGITNDMARRLKKHRSGKGSKYVRGKTICGVVYKECAFDRSAASKREAEIKKMTKLNKTRLIEKSRLIEKEKTMDFKISPLYDQVFVKKDEAATTKSGLHLTETVKGRAVTATVVAVGPGLLSPYTGGYLPMSVEVGDRVYLREFSGYIIRHEGLEVHVFKEAEIIGKLRE